jgi:hypothetical protein
MTTFHKICNFKLHLYSSRYRNSLWAGRSGDRIPAGARFFTLVQTGPGAQPASYTIDTGSFPGVIQPRRWPPNPSEVEVKRSVELYIYSPSGLSYPLLEWTLFYLYLYLYFSIIWRVLRRHFTLQTLHLWTTDYGDPRTEGEEKSPSAVNQSCSNC